MATGASAKYRLQAEDQTKSAFDSVQKNADAVAKSIIGVGAAATTAAVGGWAMMYAKGAQNLDVLAKTADALQMTTERLAGWRLAAEEVAGITEGQLDNALKTMNKSVGEFIMGGGRAKATLESLGFTQEQLAQMGTEQSLDAISAALRGMEAGAERTAMATKIFGSDADRMLKIIDAGPDTLNDMQQAALDLGLAVSRLDAAKVEAANDAMNRASKIATGVGNAIAVTTAPIVEDLANRFLNVAREAGGFGEMTNNVMQRVVKVVGWGGNALRGLQMVWEVLKIGANEFYAYVIGRIDSLVQRVVGVINWLPGVEVEVGSVLSDMAYGLSAAADDARANLARLATEPMPLEQIEEWYAEVQARAQANAEKIVEISKAQNAAIVAGEIEKNEALAEVADEYTADQRDKDKQAFRNSLQAGAQHNRAIFEMNKLARLSEGAADAKAAVMSSYRFGASIGGPVMGVAMAGVAGGAAA